jgi:peptidoglycan/xylan/chitin deacetylase (PgdA/CDA1 family)
MYQIHIPARLYGVALLAPGFETGPCPGIVTPEAWTGACPAEAAAEPGRTESRKTMTIDPKIRADGKLIALVNTAFDQWVRRKVMTGTVSVSVHRQEDMSPRGKLYFIGAGLLGVILAVLFATQAQPAALTSPLALRQGELRQVDRSLQFSVTTAAPVSLEALEPRPDRDQAGAQYLCLEMKQKSEPGEPAYSELICPGGSEQVVGVTPAGGESPQAVEDGEIEATVEFPEPDSLLVTIPLAELGLPAGDYEFRFLSSDGSCGSEPDDGCVDRLPVSGSGVFTLQTPVMAGCSGADGVQYRYGPKDQKLVALTFDDGPGPTTGEILDILEEKRADGTFFMLGQAVEADPETVREITLRGNEVANHSMAHDALPGSEDLKATNDVIEQAAGFRPCSFRPPYGEVDAALTARAAGEDMNTVLWDVDTEDWTDWTTVDSVVEGTKANTQPGSIILMHDGGDARREKTIEALPGIIDELRAEGYSFVTVSELLGNEIDWTVPEPSDDA